MPADARLASEQVVISAPTSFAGSAQRIWKMTKTDNIGLKFLLVPTAIMLISMAWMMVVLWYMIFGIFLIPYRILRRGSRKRKRDELRHREMLQAVNSQQ